MLRRYPPTGATIKVNELCFADQHICGPSANPGEGEGGWAWGVSGGIELPPEYANK